MNDDQAKGHGKDVKGSIKETAGKITGSEKLKDEGRADQAEGKVQKTWGDVKDKLSDNK